MTDAREGLGGGEGLSRRNVLRLGALVPVLGPALLSQGLSAREKSTPSASSTETPERSPALIINALGRLEDPNKNLDSPSGGGSGIELDAATIREAKASGLTAVNITLGYVAGPDDPFQATVDEIGQWDRVCRQYPADLVKIFQASDILRAQRERAVGLFYGLQNGAAIGDKLDRAAILGNLGVKVIQLTYNPRNLYGDGSIEAENHGLTPLGRQVIERLNHERIMVDLSHSGEQTCLEAVRASKQPISINHTGCRALVDLPRNKSDQELRLVAERGGFVGIYFMPFLSPSGHVVAADVVAHIDHAVGVCGEDHVGIGTDGPVTAIADLERYRGALAKEVAQRRAQGVSAAGERPDTLPFAIDLRGVDQFQKLGTLLRARGYSQTRIDKILGLNFLHFAETVWGS
jgi:membrane dipeptidase